MTGIRLVGFVLAALLGNTIATDHYVVPSSGLRAQTIDGTLVETKVVNLGFTQPILALVLALKDNSHETVLVMFPLFYQGQIYPCLDVNAGNPADECRTNDALHPLAFDKGARYTVVVFPVSLPNKYTGLATNWIIEPDYPMVRPTSPV